MQARLVIAVALLASAASPAGAMTTLELEIVLNGRPTGVIADVDDDGGRLLLSRADLDALGVRAPPGDGPIDLRATAGFDARLDAATQRLLVAVSFDRLTPTTIALAEAGSGALSESATGFTLNYDVTATAAGGPVVGRAAFDARLFGPAGVLSSGFLASAGGGRGVAAIRLDTTFTAADPATLRTVQIGDVVGAGLAWTRPVRMGGGAISRDFSLRPDLATFPLPTVRGQAAVPSSVDILVNGAPSVSASVEAGPFEAPRLPVVSGAGTIVTTLTDSVGRQVSTVLPFYASTALLAPGLHSYAVEVGAVRRNWSLRSNDYRALAASAIYRAGVSNRVTIEATAEAMRGLAMAGGGVVVNIADTAVGSASVAASASGPEHGAQLAAGIERSSGRLSLSLSIRAATAGYRDIASTVGDPVDRFQLSANAGLSLGRRGSIGVAFVATRRDIQTLGPPPRSAVDPLLTLALARLQPVARSEVASASYSVSIGPAQLFATAYGDTAHGRFGGALIGLSMPLGRLGSGDLTWQRGAARAEASLAPNGVGDWGYHFAVSQGDQAQVQAGLTRRAPWGLFSAEATQTGGRAAGRLSTQGSLSFAGGGWFLANTIFDSFAVVDSGGIPGVRVLAENRPAGRTDARGKLLVPGLLSYQPNLISIEPDDIPADAAMGDAAVRIRPPSRSGVLASFGVKRSRGALVRLVGDDGRPLAIGSAASLGGEAEAIPVGYGGALYLEGLAPMNRLTVALRGGGRCVATFAYAPVSGELPSIGPVRCEAAVR